MELKTSGTIKFGDTLQVVANRHGKSVVMSRNGELFVTDDRGREREKYAIPYGATLLVRNGEKVSAKDRVSEWDGFNTPILATDTGVVVFEDFDENTVMETSDPLTGRKIREIKDFRDTDKRPRMVIKESGGKGKQKVRIFPSAQTKIEVEEGDEVATGDVLARIPRETTKTKDITGGLPRVARVAPLAPVACAARILVEGDIVVILLELGVLVKGDDDAGCVWEAQLAEKPC